MVKPVLIGFAIVLGGATSAVAQQCLHGADETPADRARRGQAVDFAHRLNAAEQLSFGTPRYRQPGDPVFRYRPPDELANLPPVPAGFHLQFHTDGRTYSFSVKDTRDPCHFAVFSDQDRRVYAALPQASRATVIPLDTR